MAVQHRMDERRYEPLPLDPDRPADFWVVSGPGAELPGGGETGDPWGELVARYGPARVSGELNVVRAWLERLPGWAFDLDVGVEVLGAVQDGVPAPVPDDARIRRVFLPDRWQVPGRPDAETEARP